MLLPAGPKLVSGMEEGPVFDQVETLGFAEYQYNPLSYLAAFLLI